MSGVRIVIIMGSEKDQGFIEPCLDLLDNYGVSFDIRVASAHKTPEKALDIIEEYEGNDVVYITVAGRSNALSGFVDGNTTSPVIACPPYSDKFGGGDIFSSLRMPSGVSPMVVMSPKNAALAALKILGMKDSKFEEKVSSYQEKVKEKVEESDRKID